MQKIIEAVECVLEFLRSIPLSNSSIKQYRIYLLHSIIPYCAANGISVFSDDELQAYADEQMSGLKNGKFCKSTMMHRRKAAALLADCMQCRELVWGHKSFKREKLLGHFEETLADYSIHIGQFLGIRTVRRQVGIIRQFLVFIEQNGIQDFTMLTSNEVKGFIAEAAPKNKSSMPTLTGAIKRFLSYLSDNEIAFVNAERFLVNPISRYRKLLPCFTETELAAILGAIDKNTSIGKRDYAIITLALWTGLRCVDILDLKRSDIDWGRNVINVVQSKTGVEFQTVLSTGTGNAIADYILNSRPETDSQYIFVRHHRPYTRLSDSTGMEIMSRSLRNAGIYHKAWDGKSFHAFRRTFGTRLVQAGMPIPFVGEMLGHADPNSAKRYVALDVDGLRLCCLDISRFNTKKAGLK